MTFHTLSALSAPTADQNSPFHAENKNRTYILPFPVNLSSNQQFQNKFVQLNKEHFFLQFLSKIKRKFPKKIPLQITTGAVRSLTPFLRFNIKVVAGKKHRIPMPLGLSTRGRFQALFWLFTAKKPYPKQMRLVDRLSTETVNSYKNVSFSHEQREYFHNVAIASHPLLKFLRKLKKKFNTQKLNFKATNQNFKNKFKI